MSRHAAPDDEAPSTPPTSDTGPLFLGHGGWPPLNPNQPSAPAQESFASRDTENVDLESNGAYEHPTTPAPVHHEQQSPMAQRWSDTGDPHVEDSQVEVPQLEDPHVEDSQAEHPAEPADDLGLLPVEPTTEAGHRRRGRDAVPARRGRRPLGILVSLGVIAALVTGIFFGGRVIVDLISTDPAADYSGQGSGTVEIEVASGASTAQIAEVLVESDVVASAEAFLNAANSNPDILTIQPGVYQMRE